MVRMTIPLPLLTFPDILFINCKISPSYVQAKVTLRTQSWVLHSPFLKAIHGFRDSIGKYKKVFPELCLLPRRCYQPLSGFLVNGQLPRVPRHSRLFANDKVDNGIKPGLYIDLLAFTLRLSMTLENLS